MKPTPPFRILRDKQLTGDERLTLRCAINRCSSLADSYPEYTWEVRDNLGEVVWFRFPNGIATTVS